MYNYLILLSNNLRLNIESHFIPRSVIYKRRGQQLFLVTEDEGAGKKYGVREYPTMMVIDYTGKTIVAEERYDLFSALAQFDLSVGDRAAILRGRFGDGNPDVRWAAGNAYEKLTYRADIGGQ